MKFNVMLMNYVLPVILQECAPNVNMSVYYYFQISYEKNNILLIIFLIDDKIVGGSCICGKIENCLSCSSPDICTKAVNGN